MLRMLVTCMELHGGFDKASSGGSMVVSTYHKEP